MRSRITARGLGIFALSMASVLGVSNLGSATSTSDVFIYLNANDPASYNASTPTTWNDLSESARTGTITGDVTKVGDALVFPGSANAYVDMGTGFNNFGTGMTIEFEGHFGSTLSAWERIFDFGNGEATDNVWIGVFGEAWDQRELAIELYSGTTVKKRCVSTGNVLTANTFKKYVITLDGSKCRMYVDGVEIDTQSGYWYTGNPYVNDPDDLGSVYTDLPNTTLRTKNYIGKSNWSADPPFEGAIKYVRVYTSALDALDVQTNSTAYTLTYDGNSATSGSAPSSMQGNGITSVSETAGTLTRSGYTFGGWAVTASSNTPIGRTVNLTRNTTLYAIWTSTTSAGQQSGDGSGVSSGQTLASTGPQIWTFATLGAVLLASGSVVIVVTWRRRSASQS